MKKLILTLIAFIAAMPLMAQYYNPYYNPYQQAQANQAAFEWGRRLAEQQQAQQEQYDRNNPQRCYYHISHAIAREDFSTAEDWADALIALDNSNGYLWSGIVNQCMGADDYARQMYRAGIEEGNAMCRKYLEFLNQNGPLTDEQIQAVVNYHRNIETVSANMAAQICNNIWGSSSGSSSSSSYSSGSQSSGTCSKCHGTRVDPMGCSAQPTAVLGVGHYNSAGSRCPYCNRVDEHWHSRCVDCKYR